MPEQGFADGERRREGGEGRHAGLGVGRSPQDAEEIERIVEVAEALGISPAVAAAALRDEDGSVPTRSRLARSIERVEERLERHA